MYFVSFNEDGSKLVTTNYWEQDELPAWTGILQGKQYIHIFVNDEAMNHIKREVDISQVRRVKVIRGIMPVIKQADGWQLELVDGTPIPYSLFGTINSFTGFVPKRSDNGKRIKISFWHRGNLVFGPVPGKYVDERK